MRKFFHQNSLSIVFFGLFLVTMGGQFFTGMKEHNKELRDENQPALNAPQYLHTGHFLQSTFENWESEFLQMALFVVLTVSLRQKGSSESKSADEPEEVDREPLPGRTGAPWPVQRGGIILKVYENSLSIALFLLFALSWLLHLYGSLTDENEQLILKGKAPETLSAYMGDSRFWFESFQNWQSEFLSVFAIVVLSIFLRQKGSPQSKAVDDPDAKTGE